MVVIRFVFAAITLIIGMSVLFADPIGDPSGVWLTEAGDAKIRVTKCGASICGTVIWLKAPIDPSTGKPQIDDKNADPALSKRPIIGLTIFSEMKQSAENKWSGTIYNADDGKSYASDVRLASLRKLEVRGCVLSILCGGETWTKVGGDMNLASVHE